MQRRFGEFAFLFTLMFLTACVQVKNVRSTLIDQVTLDNLNSNIDQTQTNIQSLLKQEIQQQADSNLNNKLQVVSAYSGTMDESLSNIIYNSDLAALNADEEFIRLFSVAGNSNIEPEEYYSTALAKYLLQVDYACSHPIYATYFERRYKHDKTERECPSAVPFVVLSEMNATIRWIDPKTVSSIHLVFTSDGESIVSSFGHVSLRIVICPKDAATTDQKACDKNLAEHVVLGFQAHVNDFSISIFKGLVGGYDARLFAYNFMDFYQANAISESRDLFSLPLLISSNDREKLVRSLSQMHWSYSKDYTIFSNNCTSMLQDTLGVLWGTMAKNPIMLSSYIRPDHFFESMKQSGLINPSVLYDLDQAESNGYYFPNTRPVYEKAFSVVKSNTRLPEVDSLNEYLQLNPYQRFQYLKQDRSYFNIIANNQYILDAQLLIEEYSNIFYEKQLLLRLAMFFENNDILSRADEFKAFLPNDKYSLLSSCILVPLKTMTGKLPVMDGIPATTDVTSNLQFNCPISNKELVFSTILQILSSIDPNGWKPIDSLITDFRQSMDNILELEKLLAGMPL